MKRLLWPAAASFCMLLGCSPQSYFYYPNRVLYVDPGQMGLKYEILEYPSLNGKKLSAILMTTDQTPKGTVVHFHGNYANLSNHFPQSIFLLKQGFDVLVFDYQGYGASEGHPSPKRTVEDGIATVRYAQAHLRNPDTGVVIFAQSLGGAIGAVVAAKEPLVKAAIIEAGFTSYSRMSREVLQRHVWTWPFSWLTWLMVSHRYDAEDYVGQISPRPVWFVHGDKDTIVPLQMSEDLYKNAQEPKRLWIIPGAGHLECRRKAGARYDSEIGEFYTQAIKGNTLH
jgi:fermentation-respiration switch protein FrsA (DUF1100 family)